MSDFVSPIEDGAGAEWTRAAGTAQKEIPDRVCKLLGLRVGHKANNAICTAYAEGHYLSFCLALLNIRREEGAVGQRGPRKCWVGPYVTDLKTVSGGGTRHGIWKISDVGEVQRR